MTSSTHTPRTDRRFFLPVAALVSAAFCLILAATQSGRPFLASGLGWLAAALQAVVAEGVHRRFLGQPRFMAWILGSLALRMAFLLGLVLAAKKSAGYGFTTFASALLISYFSFLYVEVARLYATLSKDEP